MDNDNQTGSQASEQKCFLAIYAHPDDESFSVAGVLRKYSDAGIKTALLCATRGEEGRISDLTLATPATLGQVRERELREACRLLGVAEVSFLGYQDGALAEADEAEVVSRLVYHIRRLRPQVVVTYDANGDYGHPDHMAIHRFTVAACQKASDPTCYPEQMRDGLQPHAPDKLYAHALAWSVMRNVYRQLRAGGAAVAPGGRAATIPVDQMGTPDEKITTVVPLDCWQLAAKLAAMQAHRTQMDPDGPFYHFPSGAVREWLATERFRRIYPADACAQEMDLFTGIL